MQRISASWIDVTEDGSTRRQPLKTGLTTLGGGQADLPVRGAGADQLHFWDDPPRVLFVGSSDPPAAEGGPFHEHALRPGDRLRWRGLEIEYGAEPRVLTEGSSEVSPEASIVELPAPAAEASGADSTWDRVQAGLLIDLGLTDRRVVKRWQQAVKDGSFEPDRCAAEVLAAAASNRDDQQLRERSGRLLRDFLMAGLMKGVQGTRRRARQAARGGLAFVVAQALALGVYSLIVLVAMLFLRLRGVGFDAFLDRILGRG